MDARVTVDPIFAAFGVPATVTKGDADPIETTVVWVPEGGMSNRWDVQDASKLEILRARPRRGAAFRQDEVDALPVGTLIEAAEYLGGPVQRWRVDELNHIEQDLIRVFVMPLGTEALMASWGKS